MIGFVILCPCFPRESNCNPSSVQNPILLMIACAYARQTGEPNPRAGNPCQPTSVSWNDISCFEHCSPGNFSVSNNMINMQQ